MALSSYGSARLRWIWCIVVGLLLANVLFVVPSVSAQEIDWRERKTTDFDILYAPGSEADMELYATFVDTVYDDIATIFSFRTATPLTLRLYPTRESYYAVNPLARNVPGVVAHADFRRRELVVILEQTEQQTPTQVQNNIRHELTHIVAADLSGNRLDTGFQEGIAQYVEEAGDDLTLKMSALQQARDRGLLLPWSSFNDRDQIYSRPELGYPQTLSVVAFLIDRDGFSTFRDFLQIIGRSSGYRSALNRAYGVSATELEAEWRDWLPSYLAGGYQRNALASYDLSYPRQLVEAGRYAEAEQEVQQAITWLEQNTDTQSPDQINQAQALLERSQQGQRANALTESAQQALENAEYDRAQQLIAQARDIYSQLGDSSQNAVLDTYATYIARGFEANERLAQANDLARTLRFPQARQAADAAAADFAAMGDNVRLGNALALRQSMDQRQKLAGALLLLFGLGGIVFSSVSRFTRPRGEIW